MDRHIDHGLQKTFDAILHSIENMDSMHERVATTLRTLTTLSHAFFDSVVCPGDGQIAEASEQHENMGAAQSEFHVMQSAKSAEILQNLKSMSPTVSTDNVRT